MSEGKMNDMGKHDNRERILSCAQSLFYAKGYDAVGVQEIVDTVGITKPTMYYYFKSKHGLLECLLEEKGRYFIEKLRKTARFTEEEKFSMVLKEIVKTYLSLVEENKEFYFLMIGLFSSARDNDAYRAVKPYMSEQFTIVRDFFVEAKGKMDWLYSEPEVLAVSFMGTINYYLLVGLERNTSLRELLKENVIEGIIEQFLYGACGRSDIHKRKNIEGE